MKYTTIQLFGQDGWKDEMAKEIKRLKAVQISSLPPGTHSDGDNLLLRVRDSGSRSWVFRYKQNGRAIELGLGSTTDRTLA